MNYKQYMDSEMLVRFSGLQQTYLTKEPTEGWHLTRQDGSKLLKLSPVSAILNSQGKVSGSWYCPRCDQRKEAEEALRQRVQISSCFENTPWNTPF